MGGLLYWSLHGIAVSRVIALWSAMEWPLIRLVLVLTLLDIAVRAFSWKLTVDSVKRIPFFHLLSLYLIGQITNVVLPLKLGDFAQGYLLGKRQEIATAASFSSIAVVRFFQFLSLAVIFLFALPLVAYRRSLLRGGWILLGSAVGVLLLSMVMKRYQTPIIHAVVRFIGRWSNDAAEKVVIILQSVKQGAGSLKSPLRVATVFGFSLLSWIIEIIMIVLTAHALSIAVSFSQATIVLLAINLALIISPTPGNIGTYQAVCIIALGWFGIDRTKALSFSFVLQLIQGIPVITLGTGSMLFELLHRDEKSVSSTGVALKKEGKL